MQLRCPVRWAICFCGASWRRQRPAKSDDAGSVALLDDLKGNCGLRFSTRIAVLSLFGMMNWIYTWHNPRVDADAASMSREMGDMFLRGVMAETKTRKER